MIFSVKALLEGLVSGSSVQFYGPPAGIPDSVPDTSSIPDTSGIPDPSTSGIPDTSIPEGIPAGVDPGEIPNINTDIPGLSDLISGSGGSIPDPSGQPDPSGPPADLSSYLPSQIGDLDPGQIADFTPEMVGDFSPD